MLLRSLWFCFSHKRLIVIPDTSNENAKTGSSPSLIPTLRQKKLIERAYQMDELLGISVWCEDEAGPYAMVPYPAVAGTAKGPPCVSRMSITPMEWSSC